MSGVSEIAALMEELKDESSRYRLPLQRVLEAFGYEVRIWRRTGLAFNHARGWRKAPGLDRNFHDVLWFAQQVIDGFQQSPSYAVDASAPDLGITVEWFPPHWTGIEVKGEHASLCRAAVIGLLAYRLQALKFADLGCMA